MSSDKEPLYWRVMFAVGPAWACLFFVLAAALLYWTIAAGVDRALNSK